MSWNEIHVRIGGEGVMAHACNDTLPVVQSSLGYLVSSCLKVQNKWRRKELGIRCLSLLLESPSGTSVFYLSFSVTLAWNTCARRGTPSLTYYALFLFLDACVFACVCPCVRIQVGDGRMCIACVEVRGQPGVDPQTPVLFPLISDWPGTLLCGSG